MVVRLAIPLNDCLANREQFGFTVKISRLKLGAPPVSGAELGVPDSIVNETFAVFEDYSSLGLFKLRCLLDRVSGGVPYKEMYSIHIV